MENTELVYEVFSVAAPMTTEARALYLQSIERTHPTVSRAVHKLLDRSPQALSFLENRFHRGTEWEPGTDEFSDASQSQRLDGFEHTEPGLRPESIGPYRILAVLGEGGMGVVYAAEQILPVRRQVAVKVIKPGMDSRQVIARFEAERQALAMMEHPNIARVLDTGTTNQGRPYFVMEWVRGLPFNQYCDQHKLPLNERIELLRDACGAIQHAHNKGIIHRDIKPSNVMITDSDSGPTVKVIDFGVAKALSMELTDKTVHTMRFQLIGTPLYASPEQWAVLGRDIDTRSDVYSLGVMLYEALCGMLPIDRRSMESLDVDALRQQLCAVDPPRPSRRLAACTSEADTIAANRQCTPATLQRTLAAELDWIAIRATEKDRQRRYQSPRELSDDLARYVAGHEVEACPPTWTYRTAKTLRKHQRLVSTAAVVFLALLTGTIIALDQADQADEARWIAMENAEAAQRHATALSQLLYSRDMVAATRRFLSGETDEFREVLRRHETSGPDGTPPRGFEWQWLNSLQSVHHKTVYQCDARINAIARSPGGQTLALGDAQGRIVLLDAQDYSVMQTLTTPHGDTQDLTFLGDNRLASCGTDGTLAVWDLVVTNVPSAAIVQHHKLSTKGLSTLALGASGESLFAGGEEGTLYRVSPNDADRTNIDFAKFPFRINSIAVSEDTHLVVGLKSGEVLLLEVNQDDTDPDYWAYHPDLPMDGVRDLSMSLDGRFFACGHLRGLVTMMTLPAAHAYSRSTASPLQVGFELLLPADIHSVAVTPRAEALICGDSFGKLHHITGQLSGELGFLDPDTARERRIQSWRAHDGKIEDLLVNSTATADGSMFVQVLSVARDGKLVLSQPSGSMPITFHRDGAREGRETSGRSSQSGTRTIHRPGSTASAVPQPALWEAGVDEFAVRYTFNAQRRHLAICVESRNPRRHHLEIHSVEPKRRIRKLEWNLANDMTFSPDGQVLAAIRNNDIFLIDVAGDGDLLRLQGHRDAIRDIEFSPDGESLASVSNDQSLIVWDVQTGTQRWAREAHSNRATAVAFHPTRPTIATAGIDAMVRFWRSEREGVSDDARLVGEFPLSAGSCSAAWFSPDGRTLTISHGQFGVSQLSIDE